MNHKIKKIDINAACARAFSKNHLSYALIENPYFIEFLNSVKNEPEILITKQKLKESVISEGNKIKSTVLKNLASSKNPITLAIDGWTNARSNKVINLLLISNGISYYYASIENYDSNNDNKLLVSVLDDHLHNLFDMGLNIVALTTDNESLMKVTVDELKTKYDILISMPCSAHLIQLCLKKICQLKNIVPIIEKITFITNEFKHKKNKIELLNEQTNDNIENPLKIIYPTETRWLSIYFTTERLLVLQKYIKKIINITDEDFVNIDKFNKLIYPILEFTNKIQKDNASLYTTVEEFDKLMIFYDHKNLPREFKFMKTEITDIIKNYWVKYVDNNLISVVKLFCFDDKIKDKINDEQKNFILEWGTSYLKNIDNSLIENTTKKNISNQLNKFIIRESKFAKINEYIEDTTNYEKELNIDSVNVSYICKLVWGFYMTDYYELSKIAIALLSICPSEACVERSMSILSNIHTTDINILSNEIIDAEMSIKFNLK